MTTVAGFTADSDMVVASSTYVGLSQPTLDTLVGGGFLATWSTGSSFYGQRLSASGAKLGTAFLVGNSMDGAAVTSLPGGGFAIAWADSAGSAPIMVRFYNANGVALGSDVVVSTSSVHHSRPEIVGLASGAYVVAWDEYDAQGNFDVRARLLDSSGSPTGTEIGLNLVTTGSQYRPKVTALAGGGFVASWMDNGVYGTTAAGEVKARVFDASGAALGADFVAPLANAGDQGQQAIAALPNGGFVMTWWTAAGAVGDQSGYAMKAQVFDSTGSRVGAEFLVNTTAAGNQYQPTLTVLSTGFFVIGWTDFNGQNGDSSGYAVRAQLFDPAGTRIGGEFLIPQSTADNQSWSSLAAGPDGSFAAIWQDTVVGGSSSTGPLKLRLFTPLAAHDDSIATSESTAATGSLFADNGSGADGAGSRIAAINGSAASVGSAISLASGASLTVNADGTFSYDPNHAFDALPDAASGAVNHAATDSFTYTSTGGVTATVTVTVEGVASVGDRLEGDSSDNVFFVDDMEDQIVESPGGGTDEVRTELGSATDFSKLYFIPSEVEKVTGLSASGQGVWGNGLDNVVVTGSGNDLIVFADPSNLWATATGADSVHSGEGNDYIFFGGSFSNADSADGGAGFDTVGLIGSCSIAFDDDDLVSIEKLAVYTSGNPEVASHYEITMADANVAAGEGLMVVAQSLQAGDTLVFDGSAEASGSFNVRGGRGDDTITGGQGTDQIWGGLGADLLKGSGGSDYFEYYNAAESTTASRDTILDLDGGDRINLINIDADGDASNGNGVFRFIGDAAFSGTAGEFRIYQDAADPHLWFADGDIDGDGTADLSIALVSPEGLAPSVAQFWL